MSQELEVIHRKVNDILEQLDNTKAILATSFKGARSQEEEVVSVKEYLATAVREINFIREHQWDGFEQNYNNTVSACLKRHSVAFDSPLIEEAYKTRYSASMFRLKHLASGRLPKKEAVVVRCFVTELKGSIAIPIYVQEKIEIHISSDSGRDDKSKISWFWLATASDKRCQFGFNAVCPAVYTLSVRIWDKDLVGSPLKVIVKPETLKASHFDAPIVEKANLKPTASNEELKPLQIVTEMLEKLKLLEEDGSDQDSVDNEVPINASTPNMLETSAEMNDGEAVKVTSQAIQNGPHMKEDEKRTTKEPVDEEADQLCQKKPAPHIETVKNIVPKKIVEAEDLEKNAPKGHMSATEMEKSDKANVVLDLTTLMNGAGLLEAHCSAIIKRMHLDRASGLCVLLSGSIAVAEGLADSVKIFNQYGLLMEELAPKMMFNNPTSMLALPSGDFLVQDDRRVYRFSRVGEYICNYLLLHCGKNYGLALYQGDVDLVVSIQESMKGDTRNTELVFKSPNTWDTVYVVDITDRLEDVGNSKCRFLTTYGHCVVVTDVGCNCIYVFEIGKGKLLSWKAFAKPDHQTFTDNFVGTAVDDVGNIIATDNRNDSLALYNPEGKHICKINVTPSMLRSSGIYLDRARKELFVLNSQGNFSIVKYALGTKPARSE